MSFLTGTPGRFEQRSTLGREQQPLYNQLQGAANGGSFSQAGDYYRSLFNDDNSTYNAFAAPEQRRFNEQIVPDLAEQFAGMGSGGLSSSGFRNAAVSAGTDLSERLAAMRANLRQQGAQGLMGLGQQGLQQYNENFYHPASPGLLENLSPLIGTAIGAFGGPPGMAAGSAIGNFFGGSSNKGQSTPYGSASMGSQGAMRR